MSGEFEPNDSRNVTGTASTPDGRWTGQGQQPPDANGISPQPTGPREHETREGWETDDRTRAQGGGGAGGGGLSGAGADDMSEGDMSEDVGGDDAGGVRFTPDDELNRKVGADDGDALSNEGAGEDMENRNMGSESGSNPSGSGANTFTGPSGGQAGNSQAGFGNANEGAASQSANQGAGQGMGDQSLGQSNESGWPGQENSGTERAQQQQFAQGGGQMGGGETGQQGSLGEQIREHMRVVDAEGTQVGTVDAFENDQIKLTRSGSSDGQHHYLPLDRVAGIEGDQIRLHDSGDNVFGSNGS